MDTMAPTRPAVLHPRRIPLKARPAAAAVARSEIRAAICAWNVPVDPPAAILLTSELVTNAISHEAGDTVVLVISCGGDRLRVDVHDSSRSLPTPVDAAPDAEAGRGLMLVASLSAEWGYYRTPAGKAVYFTLAFEASSDGAPPGPRGAIARVPGRP